MLLWGCLFISCATKESYEGAVPFSLDDFRFRKQLSGMTVPFDTPVMSPYNIQVYDTILVTMESQGDAVCCLYNLRNRRKIGERLKKGQGPSEMLMPAFVNNDGKSIQVVDMATSTVYRYDVQEFIHQDAPQPLSTCKLEGEVCAEMQQAGDRLIGYSYFKEHQLFAFDGNGKMVAELAEFPPCTIEYTETEQADAFYMGFASNTRNRVAICYYMTDLIDFYTTEGELLKRLHGPEQFFSYFTEVHDGGGATSRPDRNRNRDAYFSPRGTSDRLFVLYNGGRVADEGHSPSCNRLFSFTWDGKPNTLYELENPIVCFCVDEENQKFYGISINPEFRIIEYTY